MLLYESSGPILVCFLLLSVVLPNKNYSLALSKQPDDIAVKCGLSGNLNGENGRLWIGDVGSKFMVTSQGSKAISIRSTATDQSLPSDSAPYTSVRISRQKFAYKFQVTPGQKFIRLYFNPSSYPGFKRSNDFFAVNAGPYTLLSNFSASLTADSIGVNYFMKEFCMTVEEDQLLVITFSPFLDGISKEAYAFVNGIEIISMPSRLYYTLEGESGGNVVGKNYNFSVDQSTALETVHRLNVGGSSISSTEDTDLSREWSDDSNFLVESDVQPVTTTIRINYRSIPTYAAPQKVYQTSWATIPNKRAKKAYNFTWKLPIDLGFRYLIRFHFCELEYEIHKSSRLRFSIVINDLMAEVDANIIQWSGGNGVAVYRDYVVTMEGDRMQGKQPLLISIRPHLRNNDEWMNEINDAILKGLEVFKLSNPDNNLAGVNPVPIRRALSSSNPSSRKFVFARGGNAIATAIVILISLVSIIAYQLRILSEGYGNNEVSSSLSESLSRRFSLAEVRLATNNFDSLLVVGKGGFGNVYKGVIDGGETTVALKRLNSKSKQGADEFWTEIEMLSKLRHRHLVSLIGFCDEGHEMILVYEFMEHGTLADHLYKNSRNGGTGPQLSWDQKLNICIGAARGLDYLHTGTRHGIIHRDVKTTNILLDNEWVSRISDFGLCKIGTTDQSHTHVSTNVKGTFGYLDPEYFLTRRLTKKSDVYAFGVVLLEVLSGRPAVDMSLSEERCSLISWARLCMKEEKLDELIDPGLRDQISSHCLKVLTDVAYKCLNNRPKGRPTMADVVVCLEGALSSQIQTGEVSLEQNEQSKVSDNGSDEEHVDDTIQLDDAPMQSALSSPSTPAQDRMIMPQNQNVSVSKFSKAFQWSIGLFTKGKYSQNLSGLSSKVSSASGLNTPEGEVLQSSNMMNFSFDELKKATRNFRPGNVLDEGGFRCVFKGYIDENTFTAAKPGTGMVIAVKSLDQGDCQDHEEWLTRINYLGQLHHSNLVKLIGYCLEDDHRLLVYEFMSRGSFESQLFRRSFDSQPPAWGLRVKVALGAAKGLAFLHRPDVNVIYRDFRTSNILLDSNDNAKLSKFTLATYGPLDGSSNVSTRVLGTMGYAAPEYVATGHLTTRNDVYCFGVVLLEMMTGRRAIDRNGPNMEQNLVDWAKPQLTSKRRILRIMDPRIEGQYSWGDIRIAATLADKCLASDPKLRPKMDEVVRLLEQIQDREGVTDIIF